MRTFSENFKSSLNNVRQLNAIVSYLSDTGTYVLTTEDDKKLKTEDGLKLLGTEKGYIEYEASSINSINPIFDIVFGKTICKGITIDCNQEIPVGTKIKHHIGVLVNDDYEYMDFGTYVITNVTYKADTNSYLLDAYDLMIYSNISYDDNPLSITFPITIGNLIQAIGNKINLITNLDNTTGILDEIINKDVWKGLGLQYRDILDDLSAVTGSLKVNYNNELVNSTTYSNDTETTITDTDMSDNNVDIGKEIIINHLTITTNEYTILNEYKNSSSIENNGDNIFQINDNLLLNVYSDTLGEYAWNMLNQISFNVCDIRTTGLLVYEPFDKFNIEHNNETYSTILLKDEIEIKKGLMERIISDNIITTNEYRVVNKDKNKLNNASIELDKANAQVVIKATSNGNLVQCELNADASEGTSFNVKADDIHLEGYTTINEGFIIDENGNMTCHDANINGNLVTTNGVITNLIFPAEGWGWLFKNAYDSLGADYVGWNVNNEYTDIQQSFLNFSIRIPENFIVTSAKIILRHSPMTWGDPNSSTNYPGRCKNVKLYNVSGLGQSGFGLYMSYAYIGGNTPNFGSPITNDNFTFSSSQFQEQTSSDFSSIFNGTGTYNIAVKSSDTKTSSQQILDAPWQYLGPDTGILTGYAEIIGYLNINGNNRNVEEPTRGELTKGSNEIIEEPEEIIDEEEPTKKEGIK